jgi:hypothetical protein
VRAPPRTDDVPRRAGRPAAGGRGMRSCPTRESYRARFAPDLRVVFDRCLISAGRPGTDRDPLVALVDRRRTGGPSSACLERGNGTSAGLDSVSHQRLCAVAHPPVDVPRLALGGKQSARVDRRLLATPQRDPVPLSLNESTPQTPCNSNVSPVTQKPMPNSCLTVSGSCRKIAATIESRIVADVLATNPTAARCHPARCA